MYLLSQPARQCALELLADAGLQLAAETLENVRIHSALKPYPAEAWWKRAVLLGARRRSVAGIALGLDIHVAHSGLLSSWPLVMHELAHVAQYATQGVPGFLASYSLEYLRARLNGKDDYRAYLDLSAEAQARRVEAAAHLREPPESLWMIACS
jgi:hypothetical protein